TTEYQKPCICVCFGSTWTFNFLKKSTNLTGSEFNIPIMIRIKHAIKAFKMMYEYKSKKLKV
ncbi:MAG: hypothetical protein ACFFBP_18545, partial [Promethearchaeota archaeon]